MNTQIFHASLATTIALCGNSGDDDMGDDGIFYCFRGENKTKQENNIHLRMSLSNKSLCFHISAASIFITHFHVCLLLHTKTNCVGVAKCRRRWRNEKFKARIQWGDIIFIERWIENINKFWRFATGAGAGTGTRAQLFSLQRDSWFLASMWIACVLSLCMPWRVFSAIMCLQLDDYWNSFDWVVRCSFDCSIESREWERQHADTSARNARRMFSLTEQTQIARLPISTNASFVHRSRQMR